MSNNTAITERILHEHIRDYPCAVYIFSVIDGEPVYQFANTVFLQLYNTSVSTLKSNPLHFIDVVIPEYIDEFRELVLRSIESETDFVWTGRVLIDSQPYWLRVDAILDDDKWTIVVQDVTDQKHAERILNEGERRLLGLLESLTAVAVQGYEMDGTVIYWNTASEQFYGYTKQQALGKNLLDLIIPPALRDVVAQELMMMSTTGKPMPSGELELMRSDGTMIPVFSSHSLIERPGHGPELFCIDTDLSHVKNTERELLRAQKIGKVGTWKVDLRNDRVSGSPEFYRLLGIESDPNIRNNLTVTDIERYIHPDDLTRFKEYWEQVCQGNSILFETRSAHDAGASWLRSINEFDEYVDNQPCTVLGTLQDVTREKFYAMHLEQIAYNDYLTGLGNKYSFEQKVDEKIANINSMLCISYVDIDGLYHINTRISSVIGDRVICIIASRLEEYIKLYGHVFCMGGDKFGLVIDKEMPLDQINTIADEIRALASEPIQVQDDELYITVSIGTAYTLNAQAQKSAFLLRTAENALYQSKLKGRNKHTCFSVQKYFLDTKFQSKLECIRSALANNEFVLYYQPKVNIVTNECVGVEALIRWEHPHEGLLGPGQFLPYIEGHPLIVEVGDWVIENALRQQALWCDQGFDIPISLNVSSIQLEHPMFVNKMEAQIHKNQLVNASILEIEILESGPILNIDESTDKFDRIRELGIKISLDDFGTGHSSLQFLKSIKPDIIKIDRSFVMNIDSDSECKTIVQAIIDLGRLFDATVVAEGLETAQHRQTLMDLGCDYAQGFAISKAIPGDQVIDWILDWENTA